VTAQGSAYTRFRRALGSGSALMAMAAAAELDHIELEDALGLCLLLARAGDRRFDRAAGRWLGRLTIERGLGAADLQQATAALAVLRERPDDDGARLALERVLEPDPNAQSSRVTRPEPTS